MPDCVRAATHFGTLNFSGLLNGKYDLVIIDVHARKELFFIVHKKLPCKLRIHQAVSCINRYVAHVIQQFPHCVFLGYVISCGQICLSPVFFKCLMLNSE